MAVEGWGYIRALYMTVIIISKFGISEVRAVGTMERVFTMVIVLTGV
jgi:hypothetical protein